MFARGTHDEQFTRLTVNDCRRIAMAVVEALFTHVSVGNHHGSTPRLAIILADFAHNVDALVAADVSVAVMPVVGNGEQFTVS